MQVFLVPDPAKCCITDTCNLTLLTLNTDVDDEAAKKESVKKHSAKKESVKKESVKKQSAKKQSAKKQSAKKHSGTWCQIFMYAIDYLQSTVTVMLKNMHII